MRSRRIQRRATAVAFLALVSLPVGGLPGGPPAATVASESWPLDVRLEFRAGTLGLYVGGAGLSVLDLEGDGAVEIVATSYAGDFWPAQFWYQLSHRPAGYRQTWVAPSCPSPLWGLAVANVDADPALEVVLTGEYQIQIVDGRTREVERVIPTAVSMAYTPQLADVDGDGAAEITFCSLDGLFIYDLATGAADVNGILGMCDAVAVGNVDGDNGHEIVMHTVNSELAYVLDGATRAIEWAPTLGYLRHLRLGDLDGDGQAEIVVGTDRAIHVHDAVSHVEENTIVPTPLPFLDGLELLDVEGDGALEIVYFDSTLHVLDGRTGQPRWRVEDAYDVTAVAVGDPDGDGARELVLGAEHTLFVVDVATRAVEWQGLTLQRPFHGLAHGDVDGNGRPDFLYTSHAAVAGIGLDDGRYVVHNARNKRLRHVSAPPTGFDHAGFRRVQVANVDADPQLEIFMATSDGYLGLVVCYDGHTHAEQWRAPLEDGLGVASLQLADVDADGQLEAVAGSYWEHTGAPGLFVYVFDAATGSREWRSPDLVHTAHRLSLLRLAQLDDDASLEILVAHAYGPLLRIDRVTGEVAALLDEVTALETVQRPGGRARIVVGTWDGALKALRPRSRRGPGVRPLAGHFEGGIDGLALHDVTGDGRADYVFVAGGHLHVVDGMSGAVLWRSAWIGRDAGAHDSLHVADIDADGRLEVMVNTNNVGVDIYEIPPS